MNASSTIPLLNRLIELLSSSLPMYLVETRWNVYCSDAVWAATVANLAADQRRFAQRLAALVTAEGGQPSTASFPMRFTDLHYMGSEFLREQVAAELRQHLACVESLLPGLTADQRAVAEELQGNLKGHLANVQTALAAAS